MQVQKPKTFDLEVLRTFRNVKRDESGVTSIDVVKPGTPMKGVAAELAAELIGSGKARVLEPQARRAA